MMTRWTYINGDIQETARAKVQVEDRAFQFGDGVYEVTRVAYGRPFAWQRHLARMKRSAAKIHISFDTVSRQIEEASRVLLKEHTVEFGQLYMQVTRGVAPRIHSFPRPSVEPTVVVTISDVPLRSWDDFERGECAIIVNDDRWFHCDIKSTSLLPNVLAKETAVNQGAQEAILAKDGKIVTEGSSSNVFIVDHGILYTHPDCNLILPGITKDIVKKIASELNIKLVEKPFSVETLRNANEVFITSTLHDVCPILKVNNAPIGDGKAGPIARSLNAAFLKLYDPRQDLENI